MTLKLKLEPLVAPASRAVCKAKLMEENPAATLTQAMLLKPRAALTQDYQPNSPTQIHYLANDGSQQANAVGQQDTVDQKERVIMEQETQPT